MAPRLPFLSGAAKRPAARASYRMSCRQLREEIGAGKTVDALMTSAAWTSAAAEQAVEYAQAGAAALGATPTATRVVAERFFDEGGGMQLVIHAPFGSRINRAWGLALRKRFCRSFNFELQAAATDNGIVISLGEQHSFPLDVGVRVSARRHGGRSADASAAGIPDVHGAVALECHASAHHSALFGAAARRHRPSSGCAPMT